MSKCPGCGVPVSPFAAGCAVCGADLEAARARASARRTPELPRLPRLPRLRTRTGNIDWVHVAIAFALALAAPPIGLLLAAYWAVQSNRYSGRTMTVLMLAAGAVALAALIAPFWFWSHLL